MTRFPFGRGRPGTEATVGDRYRPVEVPILTEAKRRAAVGDLGGALRYAYPRVLADLERAFEVEFPPGFSHEEIVERAFTPAMAPLRVFLDQLYRMYAPARYGGAGPPAGSAEELVELLKSLYAADPMWRLYVRPGRARGSREPDGEDPAAIRPARGG